MTKKLFVIEGADFAGKTQTIKAITENLKDSYKFDVTFEPGGTDYAVDLRTAMKTRKGLNNLTYMLGMFSARADHLNQRICSQDDNDFIICDRFDLSTYVYQVHYQKHTHDYLKLHKLFLTVRDLLMSNLDIEVHYILLDVSSEEAAKRKALADVNKDRETSDEIENTYNNHEKLRTGYFTALKVFLDNFLKAEQKVILFTDESSVEQVADQATRYILSRLE